MVLNERNGNLGEEENLSHIEGVIIKEKEENDIKISYVEVTSEGEKIIGKKTGKYLTIRSALVLEKVTQNCKKG